MVDYTSQFINPRNWKPNLKQISDKLGTTPQATRQWYERNKNKFKLKVINNG